MAGYLAGIVSLFMFAPVLRGTHWGPLLVLAATYLFSLFFALCLIQPPHLQKRITAILLTGEDLRAIAPLIDVVHTSYSPNDVGSEAAKSVLIRLLKRLHASDIALIAERHWDHFRFVLKHWRTIIDLDVRTARITSSPFSPPCSRLATLAIYPL